MEALPQVAQRFGRLLDRPGTPGLVLLGLPRTAIPQQPIAFGMNMVVAADEQLVDDVAVVIGQRI